MNEKEKNTNHSNTLLNYKSTDIIVNEIINKLISLTISKSFTAKIQEEVPSKCFTYLKESIDTYLSSQYIFCDRDEPNNTSNNILNNNQNLILTKIFKDDNSNNNNSEISNLNIKQSLDISNISHEISDDKMFNYDINYSNSFYGFNDWSLIKEPISNIRDRCQATMINLQEFDKTYELNYQILEEDDVVNKQDKNSIITNMKIDENNKNIHHSNKMNSRKKNKKEDKNEDKKEIKELNRKRILEIMNEYSSYDISPSDDQKNTNRDNNLATLRKEYEEHSNRIKQELFELNKTRLEALSKKRLEQAKNKKFFGKKITRDHSGKIIIIKPLKLEKLNKEFTMLKSKTSFIGLIKGIFTPTKKLSKIRIQKNPLNEDFFLPNTKFKFAKSISTNNYDYQNKNKFKNKLSRSDDKTYKTNNNQEGSTKNLSPSGSSFYLMNMSVGVSIKEDNKFKTGGFDFYNKYKKYSIETYNKQLQEAIKLNKLLDTHIKQKKRLPTKRFERSLTNFQENSNNLDNNKIPSALTSLNNNTNNQTKNLKKQIINFKSESTSNLYDKYNYNIDHKISLSPEIKLTFGSSLIDTINTLNLKIDDVKYLNKDKVKNKKQNIFRKTGRVPSMKNILLNEINEFNKELIQRKNFDFQPKEEQDKNVDKTNKTNYYGLPPKKGIKYEDGLFSLKNNERRRFLRNRNKLLLPLKLNSLYTGNEFK